ncbi:MAG TPA: hypothetical protein VNX69_18030 [Steroidobacteraceae bacterium]|nr:hypothetical protein [Steroidobacteraceae bacterium]
MKKRSYLQTSKTNFRRLRQMKAADVKVTTEHPERDVKGSPEQSSEKA